MVKHFKTQCDLLLNCTVKFKTISYVLIWEELIMLILEQIMLILCSDFILYLILCEKNSNNWL